MRVFPTGASRDTETGKLDFEGALSPEVLWEFVAYMERHSAQDGTRRSADNWQRGWSRDVSMKSLMRHIMDLWLLHRGVRRARPEDGHVPTMTEALGGAFFGVMSYWLQWLREQDVSGSSDISAGEQ
ncbi:MAG TPA: hypothetical protein VNG12_27775 [Acidimicrobiales bacterium]|nr:hypothetical protein [Acidimicrobiales bacterium]